MRHWKVYRKSRKAFQKNSRLVVLLMKMTRSRTGLQRARRGRLQSQMSRILEVKATKRMCKVLKVGSHWTIPIRVAVI